MKRFIVKNSLFAEIAILRVLVVVIQFKFLKIYSNALTKTELGMYLFWLAVSYSLNAFLFVPLDNYQQSNLYKLKANNFSLKSFYEINILVIKFIIIVFALSTLLCFFVQPNYCVSIAFIILLASSIYFVNLLRGIINNLEKKRQAMYCIVLESALKVLFFFIYIKAFSYNKIGANANILLAAILSASISILFLLAFLVSRLSEFKNGKRFKFDTKEIFKFSYPISIGAVCNWIQVRGYRMILVPLGLTEMVGLYGTVSNVGEAGMGAYNTVYGQIFIPNLYKSNGGYIKTYVRYGLLSILIIMVFGYIFSPFLVKFLTNESFAKYSTVIIYGILNEGGSLLIGALIVYLTIHNATKKNIFLNILGVFTFFGSFFILYLLKVINIYTIGIPILLTQIVGVVYLMIIVNKIYKDDCSKKILAVCKK